MKKYALLLSFIVCLFTVNAQNPISWNYSVKKVKDKTYEIHMTATLQNGWHTYSQSTPEGGPVPTSISFSKNPLVSLEGDVKEDGKLKQKFEDVFGINVKYFSDKVDFVQTVKLKASVKTAITGTIEYMLCTNEKCLPPAKIPFKVNIQ